MVFDDAVLRRFSSCYGHDSRQEDIYETDVRPLIDVVYSGAVGYSNAPPCLDAESLVEPDSYHLRVWRDVIWKDAYHARNSCATRRHP